MKYRKYDESFLGTKAGRLTAIKYLGILPNSMNKSRSHTYLWQCDCGKTTVVPGQLVMTGNTRSCGCYGKEVRQKRAHKTHNKSYTSEYLSWAHAKGRCSNLNDKRYGARGITMCDAWLNSFEKFYEDMGVKPTPKHTLDRIDNNGNYEPNNCRWATWKEQARNKNNNFNIVFKGKVTCTSAVAEELGVPVYLFQSRIKLGWDLKRIVMTPSPKYQPDLNKDGVVNVADLLLFLSNYGK